MKIDKPAFVIETPVDGKEVLRHIERAGRTAYRSEDQIAAGSAEQFVRKLIKLGHESVLEHYSISVRMICDRGVSHEIVRHRVASYTQESTRYCNYTQGKFGGEITVIAPCFWEQDDPRYAVWKAAAAEAEKAYLALIDMGASPQEARSVLPTGLKTEIVVTMNLREWRHFLRIRTESGSHPQMRELAVPLLTALKEIVPVVFDDIV